jgi:16S rRNA (adenine1518-N6/adenine1519-N6)-dimethyltransferase
VNAARASVRDLVARYGIRPSRSLGQHFLIDPNLARAIAADAGIEPGVRVVEVGAGIGSLTVALAEAGAREVIALEFDRALLPALREAVAELPTVRVLHADATRLDWSATLEGGPWTLCANLPYNVGTRILVDVLDGVPAVDRMTVMVQREVGERLVAGPGAPAYGALSLRVTFHAHATLVRRVPPDVFWPRPSVGSVIVTLERRDGPPVPTDPARLFPLIDGAFGQRRKTMRNALRRLEVPAADADRILREAGIDPASRPEDLSLPEFAGIADRLPA